MNEVYVLTVIKENTEESQFEGVFVNTSVYREFEGALNAYRIMVDSARDEAESFFEQPREAKEVATDSCRYWGIIDDYGEGRIEITVETKEVIETEVDY